MKICALSENTSLCGLPTEHGLSLYIETDKHKILFDFGQSPLFYQNAKVMGVDLGKVDIAFLSHGHYDHGGGLATFLDVNRIANVYMHELAFEPHYNGRNEYIGLDPTMDGHPRFIKVRENVRIDDELSFVTMDNLKTHIDTSGLRVKRGKYLESEKFEHEMYLQIREGYKTYLISGCSHKGLINLIYAFRFDAFVGGFHFMKYDVLWDEDKLLDAAQAIKNSCADYYTCHCTGSEPYQFLKDEIGAKMHYISAGETITID
ncbi:MAG: MBL fold metallo-hydrolase [Clostridiales bacterium]|nr:MBL fold metallo-hydrolase [Clostridiales bacterium]